MAVILRIVQYTMITLHPVTDKWTSKAPMNTSKARLQVLSIDNKIYTLGGYTSDSMITDEIEEYDPNSNLWRTAGSMGSAKGAFGACIIDKDIYVFGGGEVYTATKYLQKYTVGALQLNTVAYDKKVVLQWDAVVGATSYNVKRSLIPGGPYETIAQNVQGTTYTYNGVTNGTTYYYIVSAVFNGTESDPPSNEASATPIAPGEPPIIAGNNAILEITMTNDQIKEYDLTSAELQSFLTWYDSRSGGSAKAYHVLFKKSNVKPFISRKEYISFDKIYSFEVKEYIE